MNQEKEKLLQEKLLEAILDNNLLKVKEIVNQGIEINYNHVYFDKYYKENKSESTFSKAVCSDSPEILEYLFSQGLKIDMKEDSKKLIFIKNPSCLKIALSYGFDISNNEMEILMNFRPTMAAIACLSGIKISPKLEELLIMKLIANQESKLLNSLFNIGFTIDETKDILLPKEVLDTVLVIREKNKLEKNIPTSQIQTKIKL
jgi:hypothetical protein